jgi:hypothetical protein
MDPKIIENQEGNVPDALLASAASTAHVKETP